MGTLSSNIRPQVSKSDLLIPSWLAPNDSRVPCSVVMLTPAFTRARHTSTSVPFASAGATPVVSLTLVYGVELQIGRVEPAFRTFEPSGECGADLELAKPHRLAGDRRSDAVDVLPFIPQRH